MVEILTPTAENIERLILELRSNRPIGWPTETVYGLAVRATASDAVEAAFALKNRPAINPLIVHVPHVDAARELIQFNDLADTLADKFWPGPLTLVGQQTPYAQKAISPLCSAGLPTLAVRVPAHPLAQQILTQSQFPLAAPSANPSTTLSPTSAAHVAKGFKDADLLILDGGACEKGLESTVINVVGSDPVILRYGSISKADIDAALNQDTPYYKSTKSAEEISSPGQILKHYAPTKPVRLNAMEVEENEGYIAFGPSDVTAARVINLSESSDLEMAARHLFDALHTLDQDPTLKKIAIAPIPNEGLGLSINDRLKRAADKA